MSALFLEKCRTPKSRGIHVADDIQPRKQRRGLELDNRIREVISNLARAARDSGEEYIYNASEVARHVPVSRRTLAKRAALIEKLLTELSARRRVVTGEASIQFFREQNLHLKSDIAELNRTIQVMREQFVEIFRKLYGESVDLAILVRPMMESVSKETGKCLFCDGAWRESTEVKQGTVDSSRGRRRR